MKRNYMLYYDNYDDSKLTGIRVLKTGFRKDLIKEYKQYKEFIKKNKIFWNTNFPLAYVLLYKNGKVIKSYNYKK